MPISPNMNLSIPVVSTTTGPQYAQDVNASLNKIDGHNHTSGQGVQIPSAGLNINANVAMNGFGLTSTSVLNLTSQVVVPSSGTIYRNNDDLWYVDGSGANVRITQGGAVAVSGAVGFSGLPFGTAGASYVSGSQKFVFQSATNTAANVDCGSLLIREVAASANAVTLSSPAALAANYTMRLPGALPANTSALLLSAAGDLSTSGTATAFSATTLNTSTANVSTAVSIQNNSGYLEFKDSTNVTQFASLTGTSAGLALNLPDTADSYLFLINGVTKISCANAKTEIAGRTDGTSVTSGYIGQTITVQGANNTSQNGTSGNPLTFTSGPSLSLTAGVWMVMGTTRIGELSGGTEGFYGQFRISSSGTLFGFGGPQFFAGGGASITVFGVVSLTASQTIQFYFVPNGSGTPVAGLGLANMPCGYIQAVRIG